MAESPTESTSKASPRTISEAIAQYQASGQAWKHIQEGFNQATSGFLDLQGFKRRETRTSHGGTASRSAKAAFIKGTRQARR